MLELTGKFASPVPILETIVMGALPIQEFGTAVQASKYLPEVISGQLKLTAALVPAKTVVSQENELNGNVDYVPYGLTADLILVPTDNGVYLVDRESYGLNFKPQKTTSGELQSAISFNNVKAERLGSASTEEILAWTQLRVDSAICSILSGAC